MRTMAVGMGKMTANTMGVTMGTRKIKARARMVGMGRTTMLLPPNNENNGGDDGDDDKGEDNGDRKRQQ